jgi:Zinc finger C-x8-C-x5-C-x3-H type (and similar)
VLTSVNSGARNAPLKKKKSNQPNDNYKVSLCNHWLLDGVCHFNEDCHFAHGEEEINDRSVRKKLSSEFFASSQRENPLYLITYQSSTHPITTYHASFQSNDALNDVDVVDPTRNRMDAPLKLPYPLATTRLAYFVFQAPDLRSLAVSKRRGSV